MKGTLSTLCVLLSCYEIFAESLGVEVNAPMHAKDFFGSNIEQHSISQIDIQDDIYDELDLDEDDVVDRKLFKKRIGAKLAPMTCDSIPSVQARTCYRNQTIQEEYDCSYNTNVEECATVNEDINSVCSRTVEREEDYPCLQTVNQTRCFEQKQSVEATCYAPGIEQQPEACEKTRIERIPVIESKVIEDTCMRTVETEEEFACTKLEKREVCRDRVTTKMGVCTTQSMGKESYLCPRDVMTRQCEENQIQVPGTCSRAVEAIRNVPCKKVEMEEQCQTVTVDVPSLCTREVEVPVQKSCMRTEYRNIMTETVPKKFFCDDKFKKLGCDNFARESRCRLTQGCNDIKCHRRRLAELTQTEDVENSKLRQLQSAASDMATLSPYEAPLPDLQSRIIDQNIQAEETILSPLVQLDLYEDDALYRITPARGGCYQVPRTDLLTQCVSQRTTCGDGAVGIANDVTSSLLMQTSKKMNKIFHASKTKGFGPPPTLLGKPSRKHGMSGNVSVETVPVQVMGICTQMERRQQRFDCTKPEEQTRCRQIPIEVDSQCEETFLQQEDYPCMTTETRTDCQDVVQRVQGTCFRDVAVDVNFRCPQEVTKQRCMMKKVPVPSVCKKIIPRIESFPCQKQIKREIIQDKVVTFQGTCMRDVPVEIPFTCYKDRVEEVCREVPTTIESTCTRPSKRTETFSCVKTMAVQRCRQRPTLVNKVCLRSSTQRTPFECFQPAVTTTCVAVDLDSPKPKLIKVKTGKRPLNALSSRLLSKPMKSFGSASTLPEECD